MLESKYKRTILPGKQEAAGGGGVMETRGERSLKEGVFNSVNCCREQQENNLKNTHYTHFKDAINGTWILGIFLK